MIEKMRKVLYIIIMWSGLASCHAQQHYYSLKFTLSAKNFVDSIPIEFSDQQIYLYGEVDGRRCRFCLDTGSSQGIVYYGSDFPYGKVLGEIKSHDANGKVSMVKVAQYPDFTIGHLTIRGYSGSLIRTSVIPQNYDAIIGFDLFNKGLCAKIDAKEQLLILTDRRDFFDDEEGFPVKYRLLRWVPQIKLSPFPGFTDEARFDTGSRRLYEMSGSSLRKLEAVFPEFGTQIEGRSYGHRAIGSFGTENKEDVSFLSLDALVIGGHSFRDLHTMTTQGHSRVGAAILDYGPVIIRPHRKEIVFQPYSESVETWVSNKQMDIAFVPQNGRAVVGLVWERSIHYQNGFRQGDVILSIDGKPVNTFAQFISFPFINGRRHRFMVMGANGVIRTIESER